jgi:hypothetical protein
MARMNSCPSRTVLDLGFRQPEILPSRTVLELLFSAHSVVLPFPKPSMRWLLVTLVTGGVPEVEL